SPAADGAVTARAGLVAAEAGPGLVGVVLRISDRDPVVLRGLARDGIGPGTVLALLGPGVVRLLNGSIRHLTAAEAASIWLDA
ncbi:ferrous iron transport protein A, partial [Glaciimonas sp. Cout2]|uniref:ferrous iron transport protein A n=1 Tax=Glaciimonas sp. Cout2 TaxID=3048621 RepID=UPI002B22FC70